MTKTSRQHEATHLIQYLDVKTVTSKGCKQ